MFKLGSFIVLGMLLACVLLVQSEDEFTKLPVPKIPRSQIPLKWCDCYATMEFDPVCGSNGVTFGNRGKLACYNTCNGKNVQLVHKGACNAINL